MSFERGMDPAFDPERRVQMQREREHKTDPYEQLELPFEESTRPEPEETDEEIQRSIRKELRERRSE